MPSTVVALAQAGRALPESPVRSPGGLPQPETTANAPAIAAARRRHSRTGAFIAPSQLDGYVDGRRAAGLLDAAAVVAARPRGREIDHDLDVPVERMVTTLPWLPDDDGPLRDLVDGNVEGAKPALRELVGMRLRVVAPRARRRLARGPPRRNGDDRT